MQVEGECHKNITAGNVQIILWETNVTQHVFENTFAYVRRGVKVAVENATDRISYICPWLWIEWMLGL